MVKSLFTENIVQALEKVDIKNINEIRLRLNCPIVLNVKGNNMYLCSSGVTNNENVSFVCKRSTIDYVVDKLSNGALYTINDQLVNGYVTYGNIRVGVSGELVTVNGRLKTIKNITGLNIRIPHIVKNCSLPIYKLLVTDSVKNTLIISPPGAGKTTFIRDFAYQIAKREKKNNVLVVDERCEITGGSEEFLSGVDVYKNCSKEYAFSCGIRSMKPDVIITDEIDITKDLFAIENALCSGVKVVATIHANDIAELKNKAGFGQILNKHLFERFVVLSTNSGFGTIEGVYNENLCCIFT